MEAQTREVTQPARRMIASFRTYAEAQRAVDHLADEKFPVECVAIVAEGLRFVEQVTGRLTYGRAALQGALTGAGIGLFIGLFFGLFSLLEPLVSAFVLAGYGLLIGAVIGTIMGGVFHALSGGQRDFTSVSGIEAESYSVLVDAERAHEAESLLQYMRRS